ncbi:MAG: hypothetical protein H0W33_00600 [Gammaproteobacteria bacterium]|nr:hypothetical protein [Gammaproteobacteria bacterium]
MGVKYYTQFLVAESNAAGPCEYSGVIEVTRQTERMMGLREIERLLARNFDIDAKAVTVLHWSRLH